MMSDPRHGLPPHLRNVDEVVYGREVAAMQRRMTSEFVVAPRCTVRTRHGIVAAGTAITADDLEPATGEDGYPVAAHRRFGELVLHGVILARI